MNITIAEVDALAERAHRGQVDKGGSSYIEHPRAVSRAVAFLGPEAEMTALLHDVIEDTSVSAQALLDAGVPAAVVRAVEVLSRPEGGGTYQEWVQSIAAREYDQADQVEFKGSLVSLAVAVKLADNGHNSMPSRVVPGKESMLRRYARARHSLASGLPHSVAARILAAFEVALD